MVSADSAPHLSPTITIALPWTAPSFAAVKGIIHAPGAFAPHLPVAPGDRRWRSAGGSHGHQPRQGAALSRGAADSNAWLPKEGRKHLPGHPSSRARVALLLAKLTLGFGVWRYRIKITLGP
jgi:hypothetical protein